MYDYHFCGKTHAFIGGPQTGKTQALVEELIALSKNKTNNPSSAGAGKILVCCIDDDHACEFKKKALLAGLPKDAEVEFSTVEHIAQRIVSLPQAHEITGRSNHVLCEYEEKVLFEDMRSSAMKGRRLKELIGFLYRQFSELRSEEEWGCTVEEQIVLKLLRENLNFSGGILRYELAGFAISVLEQNPAYTQKFNYSHVLIDDFGLLSRGMQILPLYLARDSFIFSADTIKLDGVIGAFPYPKGIQEFMSDNENAQFTHLEYSYQPRRFCEALTQIRKNEDIEIYGFEQITPINGNAGASNKNAGSDSNERRENASGAIMESASNARGENTSGANEKNTFQIIKTEDMGNELNTLARLVKDRLSKNETVSIVGTNNIWLSNVARALKSIEIPVKLPPKKIRVKDFSNERQCARIYDDAFALLQKDAKDGVAWRSILGLNDYVARSVGFMQLKDVCIKYNMNMVDALNAFATGEIKCNRKQKPIQEIVDLYIQIKDKLSTQATEANADGKTDKDATDLNDTAPEVFLCRPADLFGKHLDNIIFGGFVDGLIPSRSYFDSSQILGNRKKHAHERDLIALYCALAAAKSSIAFTYFKHASLPVAERLELCIEHIYLKDNMRMCNLRPSSLLKEISLQ